MSTTHAYDFPERAPVILVRTGPDEVAAITPGAQPGWLPLPPGVISRLGGVFGAETDDIHGRYFTMPQDQLGLWDAMKHHEDPNGYSYAVGWREDGKIGRLFSLKEVQGMPAGGPNLDPLTLANAMAIAQLQASIDQLTTLVETVAADVKAILAFLRAEQQAAILAAVETIDDIHALARADDHLTSTDWERIHGLEQVLKQQHRQVLAEWQDIASALAFHDIQAAKASLKFDPERVAHLVTLEYYLLRAFHRWTELLLRSKTQAGHASPASVAAARDTTAKYTAEAIDALRSIRDAHTENVKWRSAFAMLMKDGIVLGRHNDRKTESDARVNRDKIQALTKTDLDCALPSSPSPLQLVAA